MDGHPNLPLTEIDRVLPILNHISIFGGLNEHDLYHIFRLLKAVTYKQDEIIFEQGSHPSHIYIVLSGRVLIQACRGTSCIEIASMNVGECFGEISVIGIQPHLGSAIVVEDSDLLVLSGDALNSLHDTHPELFTIMVLNIAREACRRLYKSNEALLFYAQHSSALQPPESALGS